MIYVRNFYAILCTHNHINNYEEVLPPRNQFINTNNASNTIEQLHLKWTDKFQIKWKPKEHKYNILNMLLSNAEMHTACGIVIEQTHLGV